MGWERERKRPPRGGLSLRLTCRKQGVYVVVATPVAALAAASPAGAGSRGPTDRYSSLSPPVEDMAAALLSWPTTSRQHHSVKRGWS